MSRELERQTVATHFENTWLPGDGPIAWPNKPFETPAKHSYVVFNIVDRGTVRRSLGRNFFKRFFSTMQIDIYIPQDDGTKSSRVMTDRLEDIYEMLELPMSNGQVIIFGTPTARTLALNEQRAANLEDNWDRFVFEAPYHRDQQVAK